MRFTPLPLPQQLTLVLVAVLLDIAGIIYFFSDLSRPDRQVNGGTKGLWVLIIIFGPLGCILYARLGRAN
jgi:hypothetical protein